MASPPRNLVSVQGVCKAHAAHPVLDDVTLGINVGDRIGIVGANGGGKSTLLRLMAGWDAPDDGLVTHTSGLTLRLVGQGDELDPAATLRDALVAGRADHEWAGDSRVRTVFDGLLGGVATSRFTAGLDTVMGPLSGGERRRIALAQALIELPELLLLDEPTNHLDVEGVEWLANYLGRHRGALVIVTHDRWFLDAVSTSTWEVVGRGVEQYDGGYAAYVLARAERDRQAAAREARRQNLLRKELAWLRRGPPARTSKPRFRIDAANALIANEPPPRDQVQLAQFSMARLGGKVVEAEDVSVVIDGVGTILHPLTWRLGPGDRVALVGVNGSGKTTLMRVLAGEQSPSTGRIERGDTVRIAHLSQDTVELDPSATVLESLAQVRERVTLSDGVELTASKLCERFGFTGARARTRVAEISGGERRRLQLMRLLMDEPNVLILDEPTNDLDIDTLTAIEDLLDSWAGTLIVVSHDRYFVERVCDDVYALDPSRGIVHLVGGIEQYLVERRATLEAEAAAKRDTSTSSSPQSRPRGAQVQAARKAVQRLERQLERLSEKASDLQAQMADAASDHVALAQLDRDLRDVRTEIETAEAEWLDAMAVLEQSS